MRPHTFTRLDGVLLQRRTSAGWRFLCVLSAGLAAYGPTALSHSADHESGASLTKIASFASAAGPGKRDNITEQRAAGEHNAAAKRAAQSSMPGSRNREIPGVPELVLRDLDSQNPNTRLRALDHWETKDTTTSLDPVFEAMEDEDEAVRARAIAIIEQHWAIEQDAMDLTFSTTRNNSDQLITRRPNP